MDIPETGAIFTLGKSHLAENAQSYFFIKNDPVKRLVSGSNQSAVICESGRLFVWGENQYGQLGIGNSNDIIMKPTCVKSLKSLGLKICDIDFGMGWSVILTQSNDIFFTGRNIFPKDTRIYNNFIETEILNEKYSIIRKPIRLIEFDELIGDNNQNDEIFDKISAGNDHFIVLTSYGRLFAWGSNESNQLGLPDPFYSQPIEIILNNSVKMFTCGPTSTLILNNKNQLFLAGQLNDYHFEKFTELTSNENVIEISFLYISKGNDIFITTESGNIFRGGVSVRNKNFTFQKFYDYDNEDYGSVKKLLKGSSFFVALTKANKFFTTFSESGHHLKTFREISKFKNLRILDIAVGDQHILVLGIPKSSSDIKKINGTSNTNDGNHILNKNYPISDINGNLKNSLLNKRISEEAEDVQGDEEIVNNEKENNETIKPKTPIKIDKINEDELKNEIENKIEENANEILYVNETIIIKEEMINGEIKEVKNDEISIVEQSNGDNENGHIDIEDENKENDNNNTQIINNEKSIETNDNKLSQFHLQNDNVFNDDKSIKPENLKNHILKKEIADEIEHMTKSYYNLCDDETIIPTAPPTESPDSEKIQNTKEEKYLTEKVLAEENSTEKFSKEGNITDELLDNTKANQININTKNKNDTEEENSKFFELPITESQNIIIPTSDRYRQIDAESSEEFSNSRESKTPESTQSTSTIKLAPLKKSQSAISSKSIIHDTPKGSVRSIKFDQHSLKSQKSSDRLVRPRTPYPDGTPQIIKHIKQPNKNDLEEEDLLEKTSPNFADSLENTPRPFIDSGNRHPRDWTKDDINKIPAATIVIAPRSEKIEEITTKLSGDKSYIIKQRYSDDKLMIRTDEDDEELEVEVKSNKIFLDPQQSDEIRFINDGVDVTDNVVHKLAIDTTDFIKNESSKSEEKFMKNLNDKKSKLIENITDITTEDILTTPDNSDESKLKTLSLSNIEDDERTTASANSNKTNDGGGGTSTNPFENDLDENCDKIMEETDKNIIEVGGKGRKKVKRFINGIKNKGKGMSCRSNNSVKVEDEPPKYTPVDEHLEEKTSKVCTIL